jgi:hypothetical protein
MATTTSGSRRYKFTATTKGILAELVYWLVYRSQVFPIRSCSIFALSGNIPRCSSNSVEGSSANLACTQF